MFSSSEKMWISSYYGNKTNRINGVRNMTAQQKQFYQSTISQHDKSIMWIYYMSLKNYERHHHTAIAEVFKHPKHKEIKTIIHKLDADDTVIEFTEREKQ